MGTVHRARKQLARKQLPATARTLLRVRIARARRFRELGKEGTATDGLMGGSDDAAVGTLPAAVASGRGASAVRLPRRKKGAVRISGSAAQLRSQIDASGVATTKERWTFIAQLAAVGLQQCYRHLAAHAGVHSLRQLLELRGAGQLESVLQGCSDHIGPTQRQQIWALVQHHTLSAWGGSHGRSSAAGARGDGRKAEGTYRGKASVQQKQQHGADATAGQGRANRCSCARQTWIARHTRHTQQQSPSGLATITGTSDTGGGCVMRRRASSPNTSRHTSDAQVSASSSSSSSSSGQRRPPQLDLPPAGQHRSAFVSGGPRVRPQSAPPSPPSGAAHNRDQPRGARQACLLPQRSSQGTTTAGSRATKAAEEEAKGQEEKDGLLGFQQQRWRARPHSAAMAQRALRLKPSRRRRQRRPRSRRHEQQQRPRSASDSTAEVGRGWAAQPEQTSPPPPQGEGVGVAIVAVHGLLQHVRQAAQQAQQLRQQSQQSQQSQRPAVSGGEMAAARQRQQSLGRHKRAATTAEARMTRSQSQAAAGSRARRPTATMRKPLPRSSSSSTISDTRRRATQAAAGVHEAPPSLVVVMPSPVATDPPDGGGGGGGGLAPWGGL
jgi:hypothetical protein